jgi:hypothetical protein
LLAGATTIVATRPPAEDPYPQFKPPGAFGADTLVSSAACIPSAPATALVAGHPDAAPPAAAAVEVAGVPAGDAGGAPLFPAAAWVPPVAAPGLAGAVLAGAVVAGRVLVATEDAEEELPQPAAVSDRAATAAAMMAVPGEKNASLLVFTAEAPF